MQNQVDTQGKIAQNTLNNVTPGVLERTHGLENRYNVSADREQEDYNNLIDIGKSLLGVNSGLSSTILGENPRDFGAYSGYKSFADTGGFSPADIANLRARSVAPLRAVYANAQNNINRQRALQGGYSPNYTAASAKMARELGSSLADANTNVEAELADKIHSGKLAGLGGMTNIDNALLGDRIARLGLANSSSSLNNSVLGNLVNAYSATPGRTSMYGNQMLNSSNQGLQTAGLQNDIMRNYLSGQNEVSNTAGNTASVLGNIKSGLDVASNGAKIFSQF